MKTVYWDTADAACQSEVNDVIEHLEDPFNAFDDEPAAEILKIVCTDSEESIEIPEEQELFGYVALDLLEKGKGAVACKACNRICEADQLKSVALGAGKSPLHVTIKPQTGISNLFRPKKRRNPPLAGGEGFKCPIGHTLISMIIWMS